MALQYGRMYEMYKSLPPSLGIVLNEHFSRNISQLGYVYG